MRSLYLPYQAILDDESGSWCATGLDRSRVDFGVGWGPTAADAEERLKDWVLDSLLASAGDGEDRMNDLVDAPPDGPAVEFGMVDLMPIRLRLLRARRGYTQAEIGTRLGLTQQAYAKLERPGSNLQLRTLELVQGVLEADPLSLDGGAEQARTAPPRRAPKILVTAADIVQWAQRIEAKAEFPVLLYRLVWGSSSRLRDLHFPSGESIYSGGFDGYVVASGDHPHVPAGASLWELGTEKGVRDKAERDYTKRLAEDSPFDRGEITYLAVTARNATVIDRWAEEKRALHIWKDVRGYDAGRLAQWIDSLPAVALWFAGQIGKVPAGVHDPASWWFDWTNVTVPATAAGVVLAGQDEVQRAVHDWAAGPPAALAVRAVTDEEAVAVSIASLLEAERSSTRTARAWVVTSTEAWAQATASAEPLLLIAAFVDKAGVESAVSRGHHVLVPLGDASPKDGVVDMGVRPWDALRSAVSGMGVDNQRLDELTEVGRLSLSAFRRKLARIRGLSVPNWAEGPSSPGLLTALLAGGWDDDSEADRHAVEKLAGIPYESVLTDLRRWANAADPPIRELGSQWRLIDHTDAWVLLHRFVGREHLERWSQVAVEVLAELDPKFELPTDQQYAAAVYGERLSHSAQLREGLAETLAILGALSNGHSPGGQAPGQRWACRVARSLLSQPGGWHLWASLSSLLRLIAEACPDEFVPALERALADPDFVPHLFTDRENTFFSSSPHAGLLWALEVLAWSLEHLGGATQLLGGLAATEPPGGRLGNHPVASLSEIFKLWHPCTSAPIDARGTALGALAEVYSDVAWNVLEAILPRAMAVAIPTATPRWRNWIVESQTTGAELAAGVEMVVDRMLDLAADNGDRWASLVNLLDDVGGLQFDRILEGIRVATPRLPEAERGKVWDRLRKLIGRHREFPDARWALPTTRVDQMDRVLQDIAPSDLQLLNGWLFTEWPEITGRRHGNWTQDQAEIGRQRAAVISQLLNAGGVDAVVEFGRGVDAPWTVGWALSAVTRPDQTSELVAGLLESDDKTLNSVGVGILGAIGSEDPSRLVLLLESQSWSASAGADILRIMPFAIETWTRVEAQPPEVQRLYWERVNVYQHVADDEALGTSVGDLVAQQLYEKAIHLLALNIDTAPAELIAAVLTATATGRRDEPLRVDNVATDVPRLLEVLADRMGPLDFVADLEWVFLPLLHTPLHYPKALMLKLQRDPALFVQALEAMYHRSDEGPRRDATKGDLEHAMRAFDLLHEWHEPPGCHDGTVDEDELRGWVTEARRLAAEAARSTVADIHIGQVLAHIPPGAEGWPPDDLGRLLEELKSPHIDDGVVTGISNKQGVTTRGLHDGGAQERELAREYADAASRVSARLPRLARILRRVTSSYEDLGRREDVESEVR